MSNLATTAPVLVTGGTGFIAGHVIAQLLDRGYRVRASVRSLADIEAFYHLSRLANAVALEFVEADLCRAESWHAALAGGVEYVMHVASPYVLKPEDPEQALVAPAVEGTMNILEMCQATASVKKLIMTSCACALSDEFDPDKEYDESDWNELSSLTRNSYAYSKTTAERRATEFCAREDCTFKLVTILPSTVWGPKLGGKPRLANGQLLAFLGPNCTKGIPNLFYSISDVRDVATAHILAMENRHISGRYCICQAPMHIAEILQIVHENFPDVIIPRRQVMDFTVKLTVARDQTIRGDIIRYQLSRPARISQRRSRNVNMFMRPPVQTICDTLRYLLANDLIDSQEDQTIGAGLCTIM